MFVGNRGITKDSEGVPTVMPPAIFCHQTTPPVCLCSEQSGVKANSEIKHLKADRLHVMFIVVSALPQQDVLSRSLESHCRKCVQQHKAQTATLQGTIKFTRFISFPSQLSIHSPNDLVKKRNYER